MPNLFAIANLSNQVQSAHDGAEAYVCNFKWRTNQRRAILGRALIDVVASATVDEAQPWPDRFRRHVRSLLKRCDVSQEDWAARGYDIHHVVAAGLGGAVMGRTVLRRWSVGINSLENAAVIPRNFHRGQGLHRAGFLQIVNQRLISAEIFATALSRQASLQAGRLIIVKTVQQIGNELVLQSGDVVAIRLQNALQELACKIPSAMEVGGRSRPEIGRGLAGRNAGRLETLSGKGADRGDAPVFSTQRYGLPAVAGC